MSIFFEYVIAVIIGACFGFGVGVLIYIVISAIVWITVYMFEGRPE